MSIDPNALFVCDALNLLERLPSATAMVAYLDPPWNNKTSVRRVAPKSIDQSDEQYAAFLSKVIQQLRRVLTEVGTLFVHCSPVATLDVRLVINQTFGEQPRYEITWHKKGHQFHTSGRPRVDNELILAYSKSDSPIYNAILRPLSPEETAAYIGRDERGAYRAADLTVPLDRPSVRFSWRGYLPPHRRSWRFTSDRLDTLAQESRIHFPPTPGLPRLKQYLDEHAGVELSTTWDDIPTMIRGPERTGDATQKPLSLLKRIVQLASNEGDLVLDPFFGSGTTLIAAESLGRRWWGSDISNEAFQITETRLLATCGAVARDNYAVYSEPEVRERPVVDANYRDVMVSVEQIAQLQRGVSLLTDRLLSLKKLMNICEGDDERKVEETVEQMEHWITDSIASQSKSVESYIAVVCSWLSGWDQLDESSQKFLPQAELLFEIISRTNGQDYSPFIIQYCRALENELLTKLFVAYTDYLYRQVEDVPGFLTDDLTDDNTGRFAKLLKARSKTYTLGDMARIMNYMKVGGKTLKRSPLLQDFRNYVERYFSKTITDKAYLDQIERINEDFRCKAAHPYVLDAEIARRCRDLLRTCLNDLILNYKGGESTTTKATE